MSVYSGFATRQLEQQYNKQVVNLVKVLQRRVMKFYLNETTDEDIFNKLCQLEDSKYTEPYYSTYLKEMCNYFAIDFQLLVRQNQSLQSHMNYTKCNCNCRCHEKEKSQSPQQQSAFLTHLDSSSIKMQQIQVQSIPVASKQHSFEIISRSNYSRSSRTRPMRDYTQYATTNDDRIFSSTNRKPNNTIVMKLQSSPRMAAKSTEPSRLRKPSSSRCSNRSPYYSTVYSLNGKTYTKIQFPSASRSHKTANQTPRHKENVKL